MIFAALLLVHVALAMAAAAGAPSSAQTAGGGGAAVWDFDGVPVGSLPAGWTVDATRRRGPLATWQVSEDGTAPSGVRVLAMIRPNHDSGGTFNICWTDTVSFLDGEVWVRFKALSGREDQGGGVIWRARDAHNYYIARFNPLEDYFRIYRVRDGDRRTLASARIALPAGEWHTLGIVQRGDRFEGYLNGRRLLEGADGTFSGPGGVGSGPRPTPSRPSTIFPYILPVRGGNCRPGNDLHGDAFRALRPAVKRCARCLILAAAMASWSAGVVGQGGPPLITDDPYTPGPGRWEINIALTLDRQGGESEYETPILDINYGLGEHIQLKYELPWVVVDEEDERAQSGPGNSRLGVKWRFADQADHGVAVSVYPQFGFNNPTSSVDLGIVDDGFSLFLPMEIARQQGRFGIDAEFGYVFNQRADDELVYGLALGYQMTGRLELLAEYHGNSRGGFGDLESVLNLGLRQGLGGAFTLLASAGSSFIASGPDLIAYAGIQIGL